MPIEDEQIYRNDSETVLGIERTEFLDVFDGDDSVTVGDLFDDEFVEEYTDAATFRTFVGDSPVAVESVADFDDVDRAALDEYVAETTDFGDWRSMVRAASDEYVQRSTSY